MHFNKIKFLLFSVLVLINFSFSQDDCEDVGTAGFSCDTILIDFAFPCEGDFAGSIVSDVCPVSCDACPEEGCEDHVQAGPKIRKGRLRGGPSRHVTLGQVHNKGRQDY